VARGLPDFSLAEWPRRDQSALEALDKDIEGSQVSPLDYSTYGLISYTVPTGKTFYVTEISTAALPTDAQDNLQALVLARLERKVDAGVVVIYHGAGIGGFHAAFTKPKKFSSGETIRLVAVHCAGATLQTLYGHIGGWEE